MATALPQPPIARSPMRLLGLLDRAAASHRAAVLLLTIVTLLAILPGLLRDSADRSRRGALRPDQQADDRERQLRRHPFSGAGFLQEARRDQLAPGGGGEERRGAGHALGDDQHLGLSHPLADRGDRRRAAGLLDGARLRRPPPRRAGRAHARGLRDVRPAGPPRPHRRGADGGLPRRTRRHGADLSGGAPSAGNVQRAGCCPPSSGPPWPRACC